MTILACGLYRTGRLGAPLTDRLLPPATSEQTEHLAARAPQPTGSGPQRLRRPSHLATPGEKEVAAAPRPLRLRTSVAC